MKALLVAALVVLSVLPHNPLIGAPPDATPAAAVDRYVKVQSRASELEKIVLVVFGGVVTLCVQLVLARLKDKRSQFRIYRLAFRGFPKYHRRLFFDGLTDEVWEAKIPSHLRDHCITFVFFLEAVGRAVAKDVRVAVHAKKETGIVAHQFLVAKTAICGRLQTKTVDDKELVATWKYINPGDDIELHLLVTGIDDPNDVEIGVDGEGIEVTERFLLHKAIEAIACVEEAPISAKNG